MKEMGGRVECVVEAVEIRSPESRKRRRRKCPKKDRSCYRSRSAKEVAAEQNSDGEDLFLYALFPAHGPREVGVR